MQMFEFLNNIFLKKKDSRRLTVLKTIRISNYHYITYRFYNFHSYKNSKLLNLPNPEKFV